LYCLSEYCLSEPVDVVLIGSSQSCRNLFICTVCLVVCKQCFET
jgi:hypothetical protein